MAARRKDEPRFLWTGLLILLPVIALAVVGVWGLRTDQAEAMAEARRLATQEARRVTEAGESFLRGSVGQIVCQLDLDGSPAHLTIYSDPPGNRGKDEIFGKTKGRGSAIGQGGCGGVGTVCRGSRLSTLSFWQQFATATTGSDLLPGKSAHQERPIPLIIA